MWKIPEKKIANNGYCYVRIPEHPQATSTGYAYEHRVVMENHIGRMLPDNEVVHHVNGDRTDNSIDNLALMEHKEHAEVHGLERHGESFVVKLKCPICGNIFFRRRGRTHSTPSRRGRLGAACCSAKCRGALSRLYQTGRIDEATSEAIASNVVCESFPMSDIEEH